MKNSHCNTLYFYQSDWLASVMQGDSARSVLRNQAQPLADNHQAQDSTIRCLLRSDIQNSVLNVEVADESAINAYTPYGYRGCA